MLYTILVVEDDADINNLLAKMLRRADYQVTQVLIEKLGVKPTRSRRCKSEQIHIYVTGVIREGLEER